MAYNAHSILRDYWSYEEISYMPLRYIIDEVNYFTPKLRQIAKQQETARLQAELAGKQNMKPPGGKFNR